MVSCFMKPSFVVAAIVYVGGVFMGQTLEPAQSELCGQAFLSILQNTDQFLFIKDKNLTYVGGSLCFARQLGLPGAQALCGKSDAELFAPSVAAVRRADDLAVLSGKKTVDGLVECLPGPGGNDRWVRTWKYPYYNADGSLAGIYGISRDITRVIQLESAAETARQYQNILSGIPGGLCLLHFANGTLCLDYANDGYYRTNGISRAYGRQFLGDQVINLVFEQDRPRLTEAALAANGQNQLYDSIVYRVRGEDGTLHWVNAQYSFAYTQNGLHYFYACIICVDAQKQAEAELAESRNALQEAVSHSDVQFFTYYPATHTCVLYALNRSHADLPTRWDNFPESMIDYWRLPAQYAKAVRTMVAQIDAGEASAACLICTGTGDSALWLSVKMDAIRDETGAIVRVLCSSSDVTARKEAEAHFQRELLRLRALDEKTFEAFSFDIAHNAAPDILALAPGFLQTPLTDGLCREALCQAPALGAANAALREILLRILQQIPAVEERARFLQTFCTEQVFRSLQTEHIAASLQYRRQIGKTVRWVRSSVEALVNPETGDRLVFFSTRDVTGQVAESLLAERIVKMHYVAVYLCDLQTELLYAKKPADGRSADPAGVPYGDALRLTHAALDPDQAVTFREKLSLARVVQELADHPVYTVYYETPETRADLPGSPRRRMKIDSFYLDANKDMLVYLLTDVTDILEQERENREKMETALAAANLASAAKSSFLSRMSHEIRTPLNAIIGMDTIAAQSLGNTEKEADCISKIGISARYLLSLINDILDMSRIESGKMLIKNQPFSFQEFIGGVNTMLYSQAAAKGLEYECTVSNNVAEAYLGDAMKLQQILINLLGNAVKFTPRGKVTLDVHAGACTGKRQKVRFAVSDTGIGIREEFMDKLFDSFEQEDTTSTMAFGGTGLGLAITKNLVNLMGGTIRVRSIPGVGSEFIVELPLAVEEGMVPTPALNLPFETMHALIVDDDLLICEQAIVTLREIGMRGEWVTSGQEAVTRVAECAAKRFFYDYILVDWKMPDMDGLETTRQIRRMVGPDVTIIIITAYDWESIEAEAKAAGANLLISKPLLKTTLVSAFHKTRGEAEARADARRSYDFTGKRILVAEDNTINAEIAKTLLENRGFTVETAPNGLRALELFTQKPAHFYDAILMDIRMPLMDGLQTANNIRRWDKPDAKTIPIIAMTANAFDEDVEKSKAAGMNAHLSKPIDPDQMYATLHHLICGAE